MQGLLRLGLGRSLTAGQVSVTKCIRVPLPLHTLDSRQTSLLRMCRPTHSGMPELLRVGNRWAGYGHIMRH